MSYAVNRLLRNCFYLGRRTGLRLGSTQADSQMTKNDQKESDISPKKIDKYELEKVIQHGKSGEYMDRIWEANTVYRMEREHNKITDPNFIAHKPLDSFIEAVYYHDWGPNLDGLKRRIRNWVNYREENQQKYYHRRHGILGPELSLANMVVTRGGKVKFEHNPDVWATRLHHFPAKYHPKYKLTEVDASRLKLRYEAIDNFTEVSSLRVLNLSSNQLDDFACDKMGRMLRNFNIQVLDISDNPLISFRGIETLHRIRSLKELKIKGTQAANYPFLELLILSFNDLVPDCRIVH